MSYSSGDKVMTSYQWVIKRWMWRWRWCWGRSYKYKGLMVSWWKRYKSYRKL